MKAFIQGPFNRFRNLLVPVAAVSLVLLTVVTGHAEGEPPFRETVERDRHAGVSVLRLRLEPAEDHYVYADSIGIFLDQDQPLDLIERPEPVRKEDPVLGGIDAFYDQPVELIFGLPDDPLPAWVEVRYMGCNPTFCYPPEAVRFALPSGERLDAPASDRDALPPPPRPDDPLSGLVESAREVGFLGVDAFDAFLDVAAGEADAGVDRLRDAYQRGAMWGLLALILLGGLALNLTPCVLPMIPVNLAIIGAGGGRQAPRRQGFCRGLLYGLGMMLVYGALGLVAMLAGARFGTLNASWGFNLAITVLFAVLALAMFDVFTIDFSRFQSVLGGNRSRAGSGLALAAGGVAALLAGACVAPVVISVLLLSADIYAAGNAWGLLLPFALGAGMALPWPLAGAGLSVLPSPGGWMNRVKQLFGLLILAIAVYYGAQTWSLARQAWGRARAEGEAPGAEVDRLADAARLARRERKPLLIDFWATWCTSCMHMKRTTLQDPTIRERLESEFIFHPFQAEQPDHPDIAAVLDRFDVIGFPTYLALRADRDD